MKKTLLILFFIGSKLMAQNLISNGDFETYSTPPSGPGQYANAIGWTNCNGGGSPDYMSKLGSGLVQLPNCFIGTVNPHAGNGCMGAAFYYYSPTNFREYLEEQLSTPMVIGKTYDLSFYITNGVTSGTYGGGGIDQVSVALSTKALTQSGTGPIPVNPQYTFGSVLYNHNWQLVSFQFTADSAYDYFTLGNFKSDAATIYTQFDACSSYGAYYFFDDMVVKEAAGAPPSAGLQASDTVFCAENCISFNNLSLNATSWHWFFQGATPSSDTAANPQNICYLSPGTFDVTLVAINNSGTDTLTLSKYITVDSVPPNPIITQDGDTLFCKTNSSYISYQWYADSVLIQGATDTSLVISKGGNYNVRVANKHNCKIAVGINVVLGISDFYTNHGITIYPNPASNAISIQGSQFTDFKTLQLYNILGQNVYAEKLDIKPNGENVVVDIGFLPSGIYFIEFKNANKTIVSKLIKE